MKKVCLIIVGLCLGSGLCGQEARPAEITEFQDIYWGMPPGEVQKIKKEYPQEIEAEELAVIESFAGSEYLFYYHFENGHLLRLSGSVIEEYTVIQNYFLDYDKLSLYISYFYGPPKKEQVLWQDPLWQERYDEETGILKGFAQKRSTWQTKTGETTIYLLKLEGNKVPGVFLTREPPAAPSDMP